MWETIGSDKDRLNLFLFDVDGATFTGRFVRLWAPGEHEQLTKGCVTSYRFPHCFSVFYFALKERPSTLRPLNH